MKKLTVSLVANLLLVIGALADTTATGFTLEVVQPEVIGIPAVKPAKATPSKVQTGVPISVAPAQPISASPVYVYEQKPVAGGNKPVAPVDWEGPSRNNWYVPPEQQLAAQVAMQQQPAMQQQGVPLGQPVAAQQWRDPGTAGGVFNSTGAAQARRYYSGGMYYPNGIYTVNGLVPPIRYNSWGWYAGADAGYSSYYGGSGGAYFNSHNYNGTHGGFVGNGTSGGYFNSHRGNSGSGNAGTTGTFSSGRQGTGSSSGGTVGVFNSHRGNGGATSSGTAGGVFNSKRR